ncbi:b(0,+)-type amino acid transporter 1 [Garra rufa]|uniref:b(0,+)-type amino acid transporter 1 n=1 Tax=Garra rufa TaxID=137080 RepID=UPI003CCE7DDE
MKKAGNEKLALKRELGLTSAVSLVAGIMIGSGIFMSPQFVLAYVGSSGASLIIWAVCGIVCMCTALSYSEMGTIIRESGGNYSYILQIYGPCPAFIVAFTTVFVMKPSGIIAGSLSFAKYAAAPFYPGCTPPILVVKCIAAACVLVIAMANMLNIRFTMATQVVFMVAKFVGLMIIVIGGIITLLQGNYGSLYSLESAFADTKLGINTVGMALYQCLWSYSGWANLNNVTEEVKRPEVNLPRALMIAIPMVTILYLMVNVSYLVVMTPAEMISSSAVAVTWGNKVLGRWGWVMSVAAALSAFGSLNGSFFSGGRVCYVAAREGHMPDILAMAHMRRLTPSPALIFNTVIALIVLIPGDFQAIVNFFSFSAWFFYGVTVSGLLYLKIKKPEIPRTITVPIIIPIIVLLAAVYLVLAPIIDDPQIEYLYVTLFMLSGIVIYIPFIHLKLFPGLLNKLTVFLQLFLEVAPTAKNL